MNLLFWLRIYSFWQGTIRIFWNAYYKINIQNFQIATLAFRWDEKEGFSSSSNATPKLIPNLFVIYTKEIQLE